MRIAAGFKHLFFAGLGAHMISLAAYPVASRLFDPASFGQYAVYANLLGLTSIVACSRMDAAIAIQRTKSAIASTAIIGFASTVILTIASACLISTAFGQSLFKTAGLSDPKLLILFPLSFLLLGTVQLLQALALERHLYKDLGKARLSQSLAQLATQIGAGLLDLKALGLAAAFLAGQTLGYSRIAKAVVFSNKHIKRSQNPKRLRAAFRSNLSFASYSIPSSILLASTPMVPPLILNYYLGPVVAGLYFFSAQITSQSLSVFRRSLAQYITGESATLSPDRYKRAIASSKKTLVAASVAIAGSWIVFILLDEYLVTKLFGANWTGAAWYFSILIPMYLTDIVGYAYTQILLIKKAYRLQMAIDASRTTIVLGGMSLLLEHGYSDTTAISWYSASMIFFYCIIIYLGHKRMNT